MILTSKKPRAALLIRVLDLEQGDNMASKFPLSHEVCCVTLEPITICQPSQLYKVVVEMKEEGDPI